MSAEPHPKLVPLLLKYEVDYALFQKKGRPPRGCEGIVEKRRLIVTDLHSQGTSWAEMIEITGLGNSAIQGLTRAKRNPNTVGRLRENGIRLGKSWKGRKSEKKSADVKRRWEEGGFDFHRGRERPDWEKEKLRASWTEELRTACSSRSKVRWADPAYKESLLDFHRSPGERSRRSEAQALRMKETPEVYARGRGQRVPTTKGEKPVTFVRSSYEVRAVALLEGSPGVASYEYEHRMTTPEGRWVLVDFLVQMSDGSTLAIEVKAGWVLTDPTAGAGRERLELARRLTEAKGWKFAVWAERELRDGI